MPKERANTDLVYSQIRSDLLDGIYEPGERLKFAELCERYGASVAVVRECLTRLVEQGLATSEPRIGFRVIPLTQEDLSDLTMVRISIETLALRLSIEKGDVEWESRLVAAHHVLERTPFLVSQDPVRINEAWALAHADFHAALIGGCASPRLVGMAASLRNGSELYRRRSQSLEKDRDVVAEHRGILEATLARDVDLATARLADHYGHTCQILTDNLADIQPVDA